jgi:glucose-1-phosphate adenylyltransferase
MVNAGITKVGVITKSNYRSLMDHLGMGKAWDLSRKREGLVLLPPFVGAGTGGNRTRMEGLRSSMEFLRNSKEEYVVMSDCNLVCSLDYRALLQTHMESGADVTVACRRGAAPRLSSLRLELGEGGWAARLSMSDEPAGDALYALNIFVLRRTLLEQLIRGASGTNSGYLETLLRSQQSLRVFGAEIAAYARVIDSLQSYYDANLALLNPACRRALFDPARPVLTKVRDDMPAVYGLHARAGNCLVADGCVIKGEAVGSVLFRGVEIGEGARVRNCVLMQGTQVGPGAVLESVITDKAVAIGSGKHLMGASSFPVYLGKKIVV